MPFPDLWDRAFTEAEVRSGILEYEKTLKNSRS